MFCHHFKELENKVALVTGASSGIGRETALLLAGKCKKVFVVARRKQRLEELADTHKNIIPIVQDLTQDLLPLTQAINNETIDILINSAGGALGKDSIQHAPQKKWQGMIDMNVTSLIAVTQLVLPKMIEQKKGDIVNISSIAGLQPYSGGSVYCGAKAAVRFMSEAWQQDLIGKGIRVMCINPGMVDTEFSLVRFDGDKNAADKVYENMNPLTARDIAENIIWMLIQPRHVNVMGLTIMPTDQASATMVYREAK